MDDRDVVLHPCHQYKSTVFLCSDDNKERFDHIESLLAGTANSCESKSAASLVHRYWTFFSKEVDAVTFF